MCVRPACPCRRRSWKRLPVAASLGWTAKPSSCPVSGQRSRGRPLCRKCGLDQDGPAACPLCRMAFLNRAVSSSSTFIPMASNGSSTENKRLPVIWTVVALDSTSMNRIWSLLTTISPPLLIRFSFMRGIAFRTLPPSRRFSSPFSGLFSGRLQEALGAQLKLVKERLQQRRGFPAPQHTDDDRSEVRQRHDPDVRRDLSFGHLHRHADPNPAGDVGFNKIYGADFHAGKPIDAQPGESLLEVLADGFRRRQTDQRVLNLIPPPKLVGGGGAAFFAHEQYQRQLDERHRVKAERRLPLNRRHRQVEFLFLQGLLEVLRVTLAQRDFEVGKALPHVLEHVGQMVAQDDRGSANADLAGLAALQVAGDGIQVGEEGLDEVIELLAGRRQRERPALEQRHPQVFFQLRHLPAHRRLLNAIRDVPQRLGNPAVAGDVIKQLQMVNIHARRRKPLVSRPPAGWAKTPGGATSKP